MKRKIISVCSLLIFVFTLILLNGKQIKRVEYNSKNDYLSPVIEGDNYVNINAFSIDNLNRIIYGIPVGISFTELLDAVDTNGEKAIYSAAGELLEEDDTLYTTDILKIDFDEDETYEFRISVIGDVLGEGEITSDGINAIARYVIDQNGFDEVSLLSADYNNDGSIKMNDVMEILFDIAPEESDDEESTTLTANFVVQDDTISSVSYESASCDLEEGADSCEITFPMLTVAEGYEAVGFNKLVGETEASVLEGSTISITNDVTYYAIVKKTITVTILYLDDNAVDVEVNSISCEAFNGAQSCDIIFPDIVLNEGYEVVGFSQDIDDVNPDITIGNLIVVDEDVTYYCMTQKTIVVTFNGNTTFDNNTVGIDEAGYSYAKTNIAADELSFYSAECISYNGNGCYIDDMPIVYSPGNEVHGFALTPDAEDYMLAVLETKFYSDATLYARIYNSTSHSDYSVGYSEQIGNVIIEFETGMSATIVTGYMDYIYQLHNDIPELFDMKGKIRMWTKTTYETVYGRINSSLQNTAGCTTSIYTGSIVDIKLKSDTSVEEYRKGTIVHELSHALDNYYGTATRNYNSGKIRDKSDVLALYNSYLNVSPRPLRDYSYTQIAEFWADSVRWYYSEEFNGFDNAATLTGVPEYQPASVEIKDLVRNYLCYVRNGYDEEEASCS